MICVVNAGGPSAGASFPYICCLFCVLASGRYPPFERPLPLQSGDQSTTGSGNMCGRQARSFVSRDALHYTIYFGRTDRLARETTILAAFQTFVNSKRQKSKNLREKMFRRGNAGPLGVCSPRCITKILKSRTGAT